MWPVFSVISSLFEGSALALEKKTLLREHAMEFCASMLLFAMLFATPLWFFSDPDSISISQVIAVFFSALCMSLGILFFAKALRHMAVSYTDPFLAFGPMFTAVLAHLALGEQVSSLHLGGMLLIFVGSYVLYSHSHHSIFEPLKKAFAISHLKFVWLGIIFFSGAAVLDKKIVGPEHMALDVAPYLALLFFFSGVILILLMLFFHDGFRGVGNGMRNNTKWLAGVATLTILSKAMIVLALAIPGVLVSIVFSIKQLSLIITLAFSGDLTHHQNALRKAIGVLLMICGAVLLLL